ncbi:MAG: 2TM domain-containing protein [Bacteroidota bacterium]
MEYTATNDKRLMRAKYRVSQLRSYYTHLLVYILVNLLISGVKISFALRAGDALSEALFSFNTLSVWVIWGIFLLIHTFRTFVLPFILGYDWEYRKLEQYVEEELRREQELKFKNHG